MTQWLAAGAPRQQAAIKKKRRADAGLYKHPDAGVTPQPLAKTWPYNSEGPEQRLQQATSAGLL